MTVGMLGLLFLSVVSLAFAAALIWLLLRERKAHALEVAELVSSVRAHRARAEKVSRDLRQRTRKHDEAERLLASAWERLEPIQEPINELMNFRDRMDRRMAEIDVEWAEVMGRGADTRRTMAAAGE